MKKKALLVGINKYINPDSNLRGCENDVRNMYNILNTKFNYTHENIRVLLDSRATKVNILERLRWLTAHAKPGDSLVFHFSGHGSQVRDWDGDELDDGLDEVICPYELNWNDMLVDDELRILFGKLDKDVNLTVIADCCHSGTITRSSPNNDLQIQRKRIDPPFDIECRSFSHDLITIRHFADPLEGYIQNHVLLAGCQDNEYSADAYINNQFQGALTFSLLETLNKHINSGSNLSWKDVYRDTVKLVKSNRFPQNPKLSGSDEVLKRPIFGGV